MRSLVLRYLFAAILLHSFTVCVSSARAQTPVPELVKDIETGGALTGLNGFGILNDILFFSVRDEPNGQELWFSDGTAAGTSLFADLNPGSEGTFVGNFKAVTSGGGSLLFFTAQRADVGFELWRTDGTIAGTFPIDIELGTGPSFPQFLTPFGDKLLFTASTTADGTEVYITDGTQAGTVRLTDAAGTADGFFSGGGSSPGIVVFNQFTSQRKAYFLGFDGASFEVQFFSTQGAPGNTVKASAIPDFDALGVGSCAFVASSTEIFFNATSNANGTELYKLDSATNTVSLVADVAVGNNSSNPQDIALIGNKVVFSASLPDSGREVWSVGQDGTGLTMLGDFVPGTRSSFDTFSFTSRFVPAAGRIYFSPDADEHPFGIYATDGSVAGTQLITGEAVGFFSQFPFPSVVPGAGGRVIFSAASKLNGIELFSSGGDAATTNRITDIFPGGGSGVAGFGNPYILYKSANYILGRQANKASLFINSGTINGTVEVKTLVEPPPGGSTPDFISQALLGEKTLFLATTIEFGVELYISDGSADGTQMLADINPGSDSSLPNELASIPGRYIFAATDRNIGREPWITDGTPAGTRLLLDINPGGGNSLSDFENFRNLKLNDSLFIFAADDGINGREIWKSDGTAQGTSLIKDVAPGALSAIFDSGNNTEGIAFAGKALIALQNSPNNAELWSTDGTAAGTNLLVDIFPGAQGSSPSNFVIFKDKAVFAAAAPGVGRELWSSDGTSAGTSLMMSINPPQGISPRALTPFNDKLLFTANGPGNTGDEPWVTDGTPGGTIILKDIVAGAFKGSGVSSYFVFNGKAYFSANSTAEGRELWVTDGTPDGTKLFWDINPGADASSPSNFTTGDGKMFFFASPGKNRVLYQSDGTVAGTVPLVEVSLQQFVTLGASFFRGILMFPALDAAKGIEPFKLVFDGCPDDAAKTTPGICGCGVAEPGICGCGLTDSDTNGNGVLDCQAGAELKLLMSEFQKQLTQLKGVKPGKRASKKQKALLASLKALLVQLETLTANPPTVIRTSTGAEARFLISELAKAARKAFKVKSRSFKANKRKATKNIAATLQQIL